MSNSAETAPTSLDSTVPPKLTPMQAGLRSILFKADEVVEKVIANRAELAIIYNSYTQASGLPYDILSTIFFFFTTGLISVDHFLALNVLRLVCQSWNWVVENDVRFWRIFPGKQISTYVKGGSVLERYADGARNVSMEVYIGGHDNGMEHRGAFHEHECRVVKSLVEKPGLLERIRSLHIVICSDISWDWLMQPPRLKRLTRVTSLTIIAPTKYFTIPDRFTKHTFFQALASFRGLHVPKNLLSLLGPLTSLEIDKHENVRDLFGLLEQSHETLINLALKFSNRALRFRRDGLPGRVTLNSLESFECTGGLHWWMEDLRLPNLISLKFDGECLDPHQAVAFFYKFKSSLRSLHFSPPTSYNGDFNFLIEQMTHVNNITLTLRDDDSRGPSWPLPKSIGDLFGTLIHSTSMTHLKVDWCNFGGNAHETLMYKSAWKALRALVSNHQTLCCFSISFRSNIPRLAFSAFEKLRIIQRPGLNSDVTVGRIELQNDKSDMDQIIYM